MQNEKNAKNEKNTIKNWKEKRKKNATNADMQPKKKQRASRISPRTTVSQKIKQGIVTSRCPENTHERLTTAKKKREKTQKSARVDSPRGETDWLAFDSY